MTGGRVIKTPVHLPEDPCFLARHYGMKNLNGFVRDAPQGFVDGQEEPAADTVAARARQIAVDLRATLRRQQQAARAREIGREQNEEAIRQRAAFIGMAVRAAQHFRKACLPGYDERYAGWNNRREQLAAAVPVHCHEDLRWQDIERYVRKVLP